jgi:hypothetical protein
MPMACVPVYPLSRLNHAFVLLPKNTVIISTLAHHLKYKYSRFNSCSFSVHVANP